MKSKDIQQAFVDAARRAVDAGFEWLELHFAHGCLGSGFFSSLANQRTDAYCGSLEKRIRLHLETLDAVRAVCPERYPLTTRLGSDDLHPEGVQFEEAIVSVGRMKDHDLDMADLSIGVITDDINPAPFSNMAFMVERAARLRREVGIPVATTRAGTWDIRQWPTR